LKPRKRSARNWRGAPIERVRERVSRLEKEARKRNEMIRKRFESMAKLKIDPVMRVRDKLTAGVLKADKLVKMLGAEQAAPVLTAQDKISSVVLRINQVLAALDKNDVAVLADLKGPLMNEINEARTALVALSKVQAAPVAELRGKLFAQLTRAMTIARKLDQLEAEPRATLRERVIRKAREISSTLRSLTSRAWTITLQAKDKATDAVKRALGVVTSPLALLGAGAGATAAIAYPLKLAADFEQARMSMDFFMGSAEKGKKAFEDLLAFAAKTPFEFPFLQEMSIMLMGSGYSFEQAKRALTAFGDAAGRTGAGMEGIKYAMLGFTQIASSGTLNLQDLKQVALNLRVPLNMFAKELGVAESELGDIGRKGIPARKAMEAIVRTLEKRFGGGMKQLSESLYGLTSTIKDTARLTVWSFGAGMAGPVKRILLDLVGLTDYTGEKYKAFQRKLEAVGRRVGENFERMYKETKVFFDKLIHSKEWEKADWDEKVALLLDAVARVAVPKATVVGAKIAASLAEGFLDGLHELAKKNPLLAAAVTYVATPGPPQVKAAAALATTTAATIEKVSPYVHGTSAYVERQIQQQQKAERWLQEKAAQTPSGRHIIPNQEIRAYKPTLLERIKNFFVGHAYGGILTRPHLGLVAEAGPEAIIPLSLRMRNRALKLWEQTGKYLGVQQYARGGLIGIVGANLLHGELACGNLNLKMLLKPYTKLQKTSMSI